MTTEPPRRRVRRSTQSKPTARGAAPAAAPVPGAPETAVPVTPPTLTPTPQADIPELVEPTAPVGMTTAGDQEHDTPDSNIVVDRAGTWLPAGIVVLVMAFLLLCAALVLVASRQ